MYNGVATAGGGFEKSAAGNKLYGASGRSFATMGPVDLLGYKMRDRKLQARRNAMLTQLQAIQGNNYMSPQFLGGPLQNGN